MADGDYVDEAAHLRAQIQQQVANYFEAIDEPMPADWLQDAHAHVRSDPGRSRLLLGSWFAREALDHLVMEDVDQPFDDVVRESIEAASVDALPESMCRSAPSAAQYLVDRLLLPADELPAEVPEVLAERIEAIQRQWSDLADAYESFAAQLRARGAKDGFLLADRVDDLEDKRTDLGLAAYTRIRSALVEYFSAGTMTFQFDDQPVRALFFERGRRATDVPFTPRRAFRMLYQRLAPRAAAMRLQQVADAFVTAFGLHRKREVRFERDHAVLELHAYVDSFDKKHGQGARYSSRCQDNIRDALRSLIDVWCFVREPDQHERARGALATALSMFEAARWTPGPGLKPHLLAMRMRCYQGRIDLFVPSAIAQELNAFVTQHSQLLREAG